MAANVVTAALSSATQSGSWTGRKGIATIGGTFVGTFALEVKAGSDWIPVESVTSADEFVIDSPIVREVRWNCTAYTSGTANVRIEGS